MSDSEEIKDCKFDNQTYTCKAPDWPKSKCTNALQSTGASGCMFLRIDQNNRCDNVKNKPGEGYE